MKPAPFRYVAPTDLAAALSSLAEHGYDAKLLAGGQSLVPTMNFRLAQPGVLIDLNHIPELSYIRLGSDGNLHIGAMTRQSMVEHDPLVAHHAPLLHATMPHIAHHQIRNRGTIGGSLAHADPASELPAVAIALDARFRLQSQRGERWVHANSCYIGLFTTVLEPDEILTEVVVPPMPPRSGWAFNEVARRPGDYALVGAAALVSLDEGGRCQLARLTFFAVAEGPLAAHQAASVLLGQAPTAEQIAQAAQIAATVDIVDPTADIHASPAFRRHLAQVLARKTLTQAFERVAA